MHLQSVFNPLHIEYNLLQVECNLLQVRYKQLRVVFDPLQVVFEQMQVVFDTLHIEYERLQEEYKLLRVIFDLLQGVNRSGSSYKISSMIKCSIKIEMQAANLKTNINIPGKRNFKLIDKNRVARLCSNFRTIYKIRTVYSNKIIRMYLFDKSL